MTRASGPITAVIAEDEPVLRSDLQARLSRLWPELEIVGCASNGAEALSLFDAHRPNILFLDIEMPGLNGLQVAQQLSGQVQIVFITAHGSYAIEAFEAGAVDYVLKPYDDARLSLTLRRVRDRLSSAPPAIDELIRRLAATQRPPEYLKWIKASRGNEIELIMVQNVVCFQAESKYTTVFTDGGEAIIRRSIKDLAASLDPNLFWQIHRATIVNIEAIEAVTKGVSGVSVKVRSRPTRFKVSEAYRHHFRHM